MRTRTKKYRHAVERRRALLEKMRDGTLIDKEYAELRRLGNYVQECLERAYPDMEFPWKQYE